MAASLAPAPVADILPLPAIHWASIVSLWSIWDCRWPRALHYLADGVFDPAVQAEPGPSLMLSLAETGASFHYSIAIAHKQAHKHTVFTHTHTHKLTNSHRHTHAHTQADYVLIMIF